MRIEDRIAGWVKDGVITDAQAERMRRDVEGDEAAGHALDWVHSSTGSLLLFLTAVLNGGIILVFTYAYDLDATAHTTFLLWMVCVLPMLYTLRLGTIAALMALLFLAWTALFVFRDVGTISIVDRLVQLPVLFLVCGLALFAFGGLHYLFSPLRTVARAFRIAGVQVSLLSLFAMTVTAVADGPSLITELRDTRAANQVMGTLVVLAVLAALMTLLNARLKGRGRLPDVTKSEAPISLALLVVAMAYYFLPVPASVLTLFANVVMIAMVSAILYVGYRRDDLRLIHISSASLLLIVLLRYVDFLWSRLPLATFLIGGALTLLVTAVALELPRRRLLRRLNLPTASG